MLLIQGPHFGSTNVNNLFSLCRSFALETLLDWGRKRLELGWWPKRSGVVLQSKDALGNNFWSSRPPCHSPLPWRPWTKQSQVGWAFTISEYFLYSTDIHEGHLCHLLPTSLHLCCLPLPGSSPLAWKIPWMEERGGLQSMGSLRVGHNWVTSLSIFTFMHWRRKWQPTPVFLPGESQGRGSLVGCHLWGRTEWDVTEVT